MVSLACNHSSGRGPKLAGEKKKSGQSCNCATIVSSFSAAPASSSSVGSFIHRLSKVYLGFSIAVCQYCPPIVGGAEPQGGPIRVGCTPIKDVQRSRRGKKSIPRWFVMLRLRGETLGNLIHQIELQPIDQDKLVTTHLRERFTYTTMAMARGGLSCGTKGPSTSHSKMAVVSKGTIAGQCDCISPVKNHTLCATLPLTTTGLRGKTRTPNANAKCVVTKPNYTKALPCQETCFTLDSHMLTSDSFFSLQTQHTQERGNTKHNKTERKGTSQVPVCSLSVLC